MSEVAFPEPASPGVLPLPVDFLPTEDVFLATLEAIAFLMVVLALVRPPLTVALPTEAFFLEDETSTVVVLAAGARAEEHVAAHVGGPAKAVSGYDKLTTLSTKSHTTMSKALLPRRGTAVAREVRGRGRRPLA